MEDKNELRDEIAKRLSLARETAGLSQGQAAKILKMHRPTITEIEAGRRKVSAEELLQFSEIYKVDINWLLGKDGDGEDSSQFKLAARELGKLKKEDLDRVISVMSLIRKKRDK
jgi:transcriptional regulator with XRE-family HTH domain